MFKSTLLYSLTLEDKGGFKEAGKDSVGMGTIWGMVTNVIGMTKISSRVSSDITIAYLGCLFAIHGSMTNLMFRHLESDVLNDVGEHSVPTVTIFLQPFDLIVLMHPFDVNLLAMFDEVVLRKHLATKCLLTFDLGGLMNVVANVLASSASLQCDPKKKKSLSSYYSSNCKSSQFKCNASVIIWVFDPGGNAKYKLFNLLIHSPSFKRDMFFLTLEDKGVLKAWELMHLNILLKDILVIMF